MLDEKGENVSKRKLVKRVCDVCGDVFWTAWKNKDICPDCTEFRRKCRNSPNAIHGRDKLSCNMAAIERVNREAETQGLSYGKRVARSWAKENVRVKRKESVK